MLNATCGHPTSHIKRNKPQNQEINHKILTVKQNNKDHRVSDWIKCTVRPQTDGCPNEMTTLHTQGKQNLNQNIDNKSKF